MNALLDQDLLNVYSDLDRNMPWWQTLSDVRQRVICNMCFNLGVSKLVGFRNTLAAMRQGDYVSAAQGMLNSAWAGQVGDRATRLAQMMRTGATA